jgi:hypothetical protein
MDCVLEKMLKEKLSLTRRNYLLLAFWDADYVPGPEEEAEIPDIFQSGAQASEHIN